MTEQEWLALGNPGMVTELLWAKASDRQLRLIGCGCCRLAWASLSDERSREAVEVAERFADGLATPDDLD